MQVPYRDEMCRIRAVVAAGPATPQTDAGVLSATTIFEALEPTPELRDAVFKAIENLNNRKKKVEDDEHAH